MNRQRHIQPHLLFEKSICDVNSIYAEKQIKKMICGAALTKEKRKELFGNVAGGSGSRKPEDYQRQMIIQETGHACSKTNMRINLRTHQLCPISQPNRMNDGFDYSEDFDGVQMINGRKIYLNMKCIVGQGGSQTRSLREVYWFIIGQMNTLSNMLIQNVYFANILDGDESHRRMNIFRHILIDEKYQEISNRIFVGSLAEYIEWVSKLN